MSHYVQFEALLQVLGMDPSKVADPDGLRKCQDSIRHGYPAYILHPGIPLRCVRRLAGRTYGYTPAHTSSTDMDNQAKNTKEVTLYDHLHALAQDRERKGTDLTDTEIKDFMADFGVKEINAGSVGSWKCAANNPFTMYLREYAAQLSIRFFPVTLGNVHRVHGKHNARGRPHLSHAAIRSAFDHMRIGDAPHPPDPDDSSPAPPDAEAYAYDGVWFHMFWDPIMKLAARKKEEVTGAEAYALSASVYNHWVLYRFLEAESADLRGRKGRLGQKSTRMKSMPLSPCRQVVRRVDGCMPELLPVESLGHQVSGDWNALRVAVRHERPKHTANGCLEADSVQDRQRIGNAYV